MSDTVDPALPNMALRDQGPGLRPAGGACPRSAAGRAARNVVIPATIRTGPDQLTALSGTISAVVPPDQTQTARGGR